MLGIFWPKTNLKTIFETKSESSELKIHSCRWSDSCSVFKRLKNRKTEETRRVVHVTIMKNDCHADGPWLTAWNWKQFVRFYWFSQFGDLLKTQKAFMFIPRLLRRHKRKVEEVARGNLMKRWKDPIEAYPTNFSSHWSSFHQFHIRLLKLFSV